MHRPTRSTAARRTLIAAFAAATVLACAAVAQAAGPGAVEALPKTLSATGLFVDGSTTDLRPGVIGFAPQYTLWSDGADKRRWIALPRGGRIDASRADAWQFPVGTRLWKEFAFGGRRVETRMVERLPGGAWRYATYLWQADGRDAVLAPDGGVPNLAIAEAPGGRVDIPSRADCEACHAGAPVPVLGFSALQLSPDRDPLAAHASPATGVDLASLVSRNVLHGLDRRLLAQPPRIPAATPTARAALGYLHANCGHCHHGGAGAVPVALRLQQTAQPADAHLAQVLASVLDAPSRYRPAGSDAPDRIVAPGDPARSVLALRMRSRHAATQMPPLGTRVPDSEGLALIHRWIANTPSTSPETTP